MNDDKLLNPARVALTNYLKAKKMRRTPERFAILEKVFSTDAHFYVDALHEALEMEGYHVSLSTVYSTIQIFVEAGLVRRHQFGNQPAQYERVLQGLTENHHHLVCTSCGRVRAVKDKDHELCDCITALRYPTFKTEFFALYVYGLCSRCQKRLKKHPEER
jgi:Fur family ferric uptake transcriptional regulator